MAARAKEERDEWEIKLICALEELDITVSLANKSKRGIELKIREVEKTFEGLQKAHAIFCQKSKIGLGSADSTEFIRGQVKLKVKGISAAKAAIEESSERSETKDVVTKLQGEQFQLRVDLQGKLSSLQGMTSTALLTVEQYDSIMDMLSDCEPKLKQFMECSDLLKQSCSEADFKKVKEDSEKIFETCSKQISELKCTFLAKAPIKVETSSQPPQPGVQASTSVFDRNVGKQPVKIKAMDCPTWDGKYRSFPRFKKMWEENIAPRHEDTALHYLLCQALPKSILENISTMSDSADDIWKYLDEKYGKSDVVAREVMGELMSLDPRKTGGKFVIKFTTMLVDTEALLSSINEIEWLVSNRTVAELEDKLPQIERLEWARQMCTIAGDTKYARFKAFLLGRKKVLENMDTMGCRPMGEVGWEKCNFCSKKGHTEDECFSKKRLYKMSDQRGGSDRGGCAICKDTDHWKNECPLKGSYKDKKQGSNKITDKTKKQILREQMLILVAMSFVLLSFSIAGRRLN